MEQLNELKEGIAADLRAQAVVISGEIQSQTGNIFWIYIMPIGLSWTVKPIHLFTFNVKCTASGFLQWC